jgi:hypothetical protein
MFRSMLIVGGGAAPDQQIFTSTSEVSFTVPENVNFISAVAIGGGGAGTGSAGSARKGGQGGTLAYGTFEVTPGETLTIRAGAGGVESGTSDADVPGGNGSPSYIKRGSTILISSPGGAGGNNTNSDTVTFDSSVTNSDSNVGGLGGVRGWNNYGVGGGGAGGYSGVGGAGGDGMPDGVNIDGEAGSGGAGGGGAYGYDGSDANGTYGRGGYGGGTDPRGEGASGAGGVADYPPPYGANQITPEADGGIGSYVSSGYGGGGPTYAGITYTLRAPNGKAGVVRLIWPATTRKYPSTNTRDM